MQPVFRNFFILIEKTAKNNRLLCDSFADFPVIYKNFLDTAEKIVYNRIVEYYLLPKG